MAIVSGREKPLANDGRAGHLRGANSAADSPSLAVPALDQRDNKSSFQCARGERMPARRMDPVAWLFRKAVRRAEASRAFPPACCTWRELASRAGKLRHSWSAAL